MVAGIREALTSIAIASNGAKVPAPDIRILNGKGEFVTVTAEAPRGISVTLFGKDTPLARQQGLENLLCALEAKLTSNATGKPVDAKVVKDAASKAFKTNGFIAWSLEGSTSIWGAKDVGPFAIIEDQAAFAEHLSTPGSSPNFVIVTDATAQVIAKVDKKNASAKTKPSSAGVTKPDPAPAETGEANSAHFKESSTSPGEHTVNVIVNSGTQGGTVQSSATTQEVASKLNPNLLPQGAELAGEPIRFAFNSAKLDKKEKARIKQIADDLKSQAGGEQVRIILRGSADQIAEGRDINYEISGKRNRSVEAELLNNGISVERTISVGADLTPMTRPSTSADNSAK